MLESFIVMQSDFLGEDEQFSLNFSLLIIEGPIMNMRAPHKFKRRIQDD